MPLSERQVCTGESLKVDCIADKTKTEVGYPQMLALPLVEVWLKRQFARLE